MRANLPKVPACRACNNAKSELEHYLTAMMPFGAQHMDAGAGLEMIPPRLAKNGKLQRALAEAFRHQFISINGSPWQLKTSLPLDGHRLSKLFEYILRGLAFHHWQLIFRDDCFVNASYLNEEGRAAFEKLLHLQAVQRIANDLGEGVFVYEGAQSGGHPAITVWRMSLYGAEVDGGAEWSSERLKYAYGLTVPKALPVAEKLAGMLVTA